MSKIYRNEREIIFEGVDVLSGTFRNFGGEVRQFNDDGKRNFSVLVEPKYIPFLEKEGVYIKDFTEKKGGGKKKTFVKIFINYDSIVKPEIYVRRGKKEDFVMLSPDKVGMLNKANFDNVELVVDPYKRDNTPVLLYLSRGFFTMHVDPISAKYKHIDDIELDD